MLRWGEYKLQWMVISLEYVIRHSFVASIFLFEAAAAQQVIASDPCPFPEPENFEQVSERMTCIESRFDELRETQNLLLRTQQNLVTQLGETAAKIDYSIYGPPKDLEKIPAVKLAITTAYWSGGAASAKFNCIPPLQNKPGKTRIGGELSPEVRLHPLTNLAEYGGNFRGCAPEPQCDSAGEFCNVQSRASGCYVATTWHNWYVEGQKRKSLPVELSEICHG